MLPSIEEINRELAGFTDVVEMAMSFEPARETYDLKLVLADASAHLITLRCGDISSFSLAGFGGGLTQFLGLRAIDIRARQLDRVAFYFEDRERESFGFYCSTVGISSGRQNIHG
jgi:hypothetical protein